MRSATGEEAKGGALESLLCVVVASNVLVIFSVLDVLLVTKVFLILFYSNHGVLCETCVVNA